MSDAGFAGLVALATHDLRTPLATIVGFGKTLERTGGLDEREARFVELINAAADQIAELLELLALASRIESGRYDPALVEADTLELATTSAEGVAVRGAGAKLETDPPAVRRALEALAAAALRHGGVDSVTWTVDGRRLELAPVASEAAEAVTGAEPRNLGALVARMAIERLGGSLALEGETLVVEL
jgi:signal transduction histidine kinase